MKKGEVMEVIITIGAILLVLAFIVGIIFFSIIGYQNNEITIVTIEDKYIKNGNESGTYLVATDKGVYKISDLLFIGKFNSSDIYASIKIGKQYTIHTTGYRIPFFSEYKNINEVEEVK